MLQSNTPNWGKIVEKHAERVFRVAFRILGSVHDAEDVCQDVFAEAISVHKSGPVRTWTGLLVRLATLRSIDRLRARRANVESVPLSATDGSSNPPPEQELIAAELAQWLRRELQELSDQQAAVFSLTYFEQLSRNEVAAALNVTPEAVSTALFKARKRLSDRLAVFQGDKQ